MYLAFIFIVYQDMTHLIMHSHIEKLYRMPDKAHAAHLFILI